MGVLARTVFLFLALFGFWLAMSGHYKWWLVMLGALISLVLALWAARFNLSDEEGYPVQLAPAMITYWPWLLKEIVVSAVDVTRRILSPGLDISPSMQRIQANQKTPVGLATFANSITLTPGTMSVLVDWRTHEIVVHALSEGGLDGLEGGEMDQRVDRLEGSS